MLYIILMHIYHFFANDITSCLFYIYFSLGNDVREKANMLFLFEFKMGYKVAETAHNINNAFDLETANERPVQCTFKKLCKGGKSLEY